MHDFLGMAIDNGTEDLLHDICSFFFGKVVEIFYSREQLSPGKVLGDEVVVFLVLVKLE